MAKETNKPKKLEEQLTPNAVRFPQAMSIDFNAIRRAFDENAPLVTDILIYLAQGQKADLFNNIRFSLEDFAKTMNYNASNLRRTEMEFTKKNMPELKGHIYDGVFEYALFKMGKTNVMFEDQYKGMYRATFEQLIQEISVHNTEKANSKRIYEIKPSDFLLNTLFKEFFILNIEDYVMAGTLNKNNRKTIGAGRNLYMFLIRGLHHAYYHFKNGEEPIFDTDIDTLSEVCGLDLKTEPKFRKKSIIKILEKFKGLKHLKFEYSFFSKTSSRFDYSVRMVYSIENMKSYENELETRFLNVLFQTLQNKYRQLYPKLVDVKESFARWVVNEKFDLEAKITVVTSAYSTVFNATLDREKAKQMIMKGFDANRTKFLE